MDAVEAVAEERDVVAGEPLPAAMDFVSLGMFIIDDIEYLLPRPPMRNVLGGAGAYAALGARLFSAAPTLSRTVGWIVDQGHDFPAAMGAQIAGWQSGVVLREDRTRPTTRGWNGYDVGERRAFRYTTPKRRLTAADLPPPLLAARSVHIVSSAPRCRELVEDLRARRKGTGVGRPFVVWEPVPDRCTPDELLECTNTLPLVDVCSPNHAELAAYMGDPDGGVDPVSGRPARATIERACEQLLSAMPLQSYAIVVRAAECGCYIAKNGGRRRRRAKKESKDEPQDGPDEKKEKDDSKHPPEPLHPRHLTQPSTTLVPPLQNLHGSLRPDIDMEALFAGLRQDAEGAIACEEIEVDPGIEMWLPAVFGPGGIPPPDSAASPVVDPTGGGNAFLGALALGLARGRSLDEAAVWGNVAASFAIQQVGVAVLGRDADGRETWNGSRVDERCAAYEARLHEQGIFPGR